MRRDREVVFDLSGIEEVQSVLRGAALMACRSTGFGAANVAQGLADAGLEQALHEALDGKVEGDDLISVRRLD